MAKLGLCGVQDRGGVPNPNPNLQIRELVDNADQVCDELLSVPMRTIEVPREGRIRARAGLGARAGARGSRVWVGEMCQRSES